MKIGDHVKLILDKEISTDNQWHGSRGKIVDIEFDDAAEVTGNPEDNYMFKVQLESGKIPDVHFRHHDLKRLNTSN